MEERRDEKMDKEVRKLMSPDHFFQLKPRVGLNSVSYMYNSIHAKRQKRKENLEVNTSPLGPLE